MYIIIILLSVIVSSSSVVQPLQAYNYMASVFFDGQNDVSLNLITTINSRLTLVNILFLLIKSWFN